MKRITAAIILLLCLLLCFSACTKKVENNDEQNEAVSSENESADTTEGDVECVYNPLTGLDNLASDMEGKRPFAVVTNNLTDAMPVHGISDADIVYEMAVEGGITRLLCVYSDVRGIEKIGSIRSARPYLIDLALPLDSIMVHMYGSDYANQYLESLDYPTIGFDLQFNPGMYRDEERRSQGYAFEHTVFTDEEYLATGVDTLKIDTDLQKELKAFKFKDEAGVLENSLGKANSITFDYSSEHKSYYSANPYGGDFRYNEEEKVYYRWQNNETHSDGNNDVQPSYTNLFIIEAERVYGPDVGIYILFSFENGGDAYYFTNGEYIKCKWKKLGVDSPFIFYDEETQSEIEVNPGKSYISIISDDCSDTIKIK